MSCLPLDTLRNNRYFFLPLLFTFSWIVFPNEVRAEEDSTVTDEKSWVDRVGPTLSLRSAYWNRDKSYSDERHFLASSAWLSLRPEEILGTKFFFDGYVGKNDSLRSSTTYSEIREGYAERSFGNFDVRVGRQIIVWGRADKVNPTDQWTSKNLKLLSTDDEDQRLGAFAVNAALNIGDFRWIGIFQPEWRAPIYPIPPIVGITLTNQDPSAAYRQYGFKLDHTGGTFDWSLSYANVLSKTPNLSVLSAGASGTSLGLNYEHVRVYGGDFAWNIGEYGFRGEAAYTDSVDSTGQNPLKFNSEVFAVVGADRAIIENFNLNFQILYKHVLDFQNPDQIADSNVRLLAAQQNLISNQLGTNRVGVSFRPSYKTWNDTLEFEAAYVQWFSEPGGLLRPKITYALNDHWKIILGAEKYFGSQNSFFGRLSETSSAFTEVRVSF